MPVMVAFSIVAIAIIAITYKTYVGYGDYQWYTKLSFLLFLVLGWCAPFINFTLRHKEFGVDFSYLTKFLYFLFGFVFFLFVISIIRDIIWVIIDLIRCSPMDSFKDVDKLQKANIITIVLTLLICFYSLYEAEKNPQIKSYDIQSAKIKQEKKLVMMSDLHIDVDVSDKYIKNLVERVNALNPDAIVIVGDIIDNTPAKIYKQMEELKKLKAKHGVFVTLGNHEFYSGPMDWILKFGMMGFKILNNLGEKLDESGIYIAGVPDLNASEQFGMKIKINNALSFATSDDYVVMLSHTPKIAEGLSSDNVDLQLSGHTHGGQIYPFHYFSQKANDGMLAGFYEHNGIKIYVSRGTRYWGPPMRLFAPSEITVFNLKPTDENAK